MDYYIDIKIKPDADMRESSLMGLVYTKLHKALVKLESNHIGVSFPGYQIKLGQLLRLHGDEADLNNLQTTNWLGGITGYCDVSNAMPVPATVQYRTISRIRTNMSQSKLKRLKQRNSISLDQEKAYKAKMFSQGLTNPYIDLKSSSTAQNYRFFIQFGDLHDQAVNGQFDSYGLSKVATVPWF